MASTEADEEYERAVSPLMSARGHSVVTGSAGCGKTTVAIRKAALEITAGLSTRHCKVLFLSFANATIDRVSDHATTHLGADQRARLEVGTYHSFAWTILRSHGYLLGAPRGVRIMTQAEQNSFRSHLLAPNADLKAEFRRQFETFGHVGFDDFAGYANEVLAGSSSLLRAYTSAYPLIILDEFQDTTDDQWSLVQTLGQHSQLIALGDPDQRIYDFVDGASDARFEDFTTAYDPVRIDLSRWNWRSPGSSITRFGRDVLRGELGGSYEEVDVVLSGYPPMLTLKTTVLKVLKRLAAAGGGTMAILTPTNALSARVYDYIGAAQENPPLPPLRIDIHAGKEEGYAALIFVASMLEIREDDVHSDAVACEAFAHYLRTKSPKLLKTALDLAARLEGYAAKLRAGNTVSVKIVKALREVVQASITTARTGHVYGDYLTVLTALASSGATELPPLAGAARMLNLVTRGSDIETSLSETWRTRQSYEGASAIMREAVLQFQLTASKRGSRDLIVMTIHRSKGREFDEVIVYEEQHTPLLRTNASQKDIESARYALNVAVTRAKKRATIITPARAISKLLDP
ncbi:UvrD-helicase domain-containing protein [Microbacterium sp. NPDC077663]|uniref:UvrD-helicase domain-containing protein n=1 Tax=Microbacterium sp. NPDC077663 TaxID=3364189 RepID=UPI0037C57C7A